MSLFERVVVRAGAHLLPKRFAYRLARGLLATQGIGWAGPKGGMEYSGELAFVKNLTTGLDRPVIFDVGANVGDYALACLKANPQAHLHCFEPSRSHFAVLEKRIAGNFPHAQVSLNLFGLSDSEREMELNKESDITGLASLNARDLTHIGVDQAIKETVLLKIGDEYLTSNAIDHVDLLKIDVEGWEMPVLKGFRRALARKLIRAVQFEFGHAHIERRENFRDFYRFLSTDFRLGALKPNGELNFLNGYEEMSENYLATNYVAVLK